VRARAHAGRHPLNCEPALSTLLQRGWPLTPSSLLYVRNHGRVPRVDEASHRVLLRAPGVAERQFSLAQLRAMPRRSVAATLVCAGNRRKEVAMLSAVNGCATIVYCVCVWLVATASMVCVQV
jgi:nitrate reductase (NAD(P)H)